MTCGKTPFAVGRTNCTWRVGRVAKCTCSLNRKAVRLREFESLTLRNIIWNMESQTIESKVASAILERSIATIEVEGAKYEIAPPSVATLILLSEIASRFPVVEPVSKDKIVYSVLRNAKNYRPLGDLLAVLILGLTETTTRKVIKSRLFGLIKTEKEETVTINKKAELSKILLENVRPSILFNLIIKRLNEMEIGDFFGITTSLSEINLLKPTKEVGN